MHQQCLENSEVRNCTAGFLDPNRWVWTSRDWDWLNGCSCWMLLEYSTEILTLFAKKPASFVFILFEHR